MGLDVGVLRKIMKVEIDSKLCMSSSEPFSRDVPIKLFDGIFSRNLHKNKQKKVVGDSACEDEGFQHKCKVFRTFRKLRSCHREHVRCVSSSRDDRKLK